MRSRTKRKVRYNKMIMDEEKWTPCTPVGNNSWNTEQTNKPNKKD